MVCNFPKNVSPETILTASTESKNNWIPIVESFSVWFKQETGEKTDSNRLGCFLPSWTLNEVWSWSYILLLFVRNQLVFRYINLCSTLKQLRLRGLAGANRFHNQCCWLRAGGRSISLMMSLRISITIYSGETQTDTIIYRRNPCHSHAKTAHTATTFPTHFPVKSADKSNIFSLTVLFLYW